MFTGYTFCIPIPNKKAETVLKAHMDHVYCKYGGSFKILSDNETEFKNKLMEEVSKELGVEYKVYSCLLYTSPSPRDATLSRMPSSA